VKTAILKTVERFLVQRASEGFSRDTLYSDRLTLKRLVGWMIDNRLSWPDLTPARMGAYVDRLRQRRVKRGPRRGQPVSVGTLCCYLRTLRLFFRSLVAEDVLLFDPLGSIHQPKSQVVCGRGVFTRDEVERILAELAGSEAIERRDRALVAVLYGAGLRIGEALALDLADYDAQEGWLWVRHGKGDRARAVPIGKTARRDLDRYIAKARPELVGPHGTPAVFVGERGHRLSRLWARQRLRQAQIKAGLSVVWGPHAFRHAFATHMLEAGADIRALQQMLGHAQLTTTEVYTHVDVKDLRRTLTRAHPRERGRS